jgi:hypothetical protein
MLTDALPRCGTDYLTTAFPKTLRTKRELGGLSRRFLREERTNPPLLEICVRRNLRMPLANVIGVDRWSFVEWAFFKITVREF